MLGAGRAVEHTREQLALARKAVLQSTDADSMLLDDARALEDRLYAIDVALSGDSTIRSRAEPTPPSITERVQGVVSGSWSSNSAPTETHREALRIADEQFEPLLDELRTLVERDLKALEDKLDAAGAPWTPGRLPYWRKPSR